MVGVLRCFRVAIGVLGLFLFPAASDVDWESRYIEVSTISNNYSILLFAGVNDNCLAYSLFFLRGRGNDSHILHEKTATKVFENVLRTHPD